MWRFNGGSSTGTWQAVETPVSVTLRDVTGSVNGPCAVGNNGVVIGRASDGSWGVVVEHGPAAKGRSLYTAAVTDDGKRVWFAGGNGALGYYDLVEHRRSDHSTPNGNGNAFHSLAVAGARGEEKLLVADGSGNAIPGVVEDGAVDWRYATHPAGDTALTALAATAGGVGYGVDSNANVWKTTVDEGWARVGVDGAGSSFYAVAAADGDCYVAGGNGRLYVGGDGAWTPYGLGNFTVEDVAATPDGQLAAGSSGSIAIRAAGEWTTVEWDGTKALFGAHVGDPPLAVGKAGTVVERVDPP